MSTPYRLTVLMRDDTPLQCMGEPVRIRRVTVDLTHEQRLQLKPRSTGMIAGKICYEEVSTCFLEYMGDSEPDTKGES